MDGHLRLLREGNVVCCRIYRPKWQTWRLQIVTGCNKGSKKRFLKKARKNFCELGALGLDCL
jgi:hypothetical protein